MQTQSCRKLRIAQYSLLPPQFCQSLWLQASYGCCQLLFDPILFISYAPFTGHSNQPSNLNLTKQKAGKQFRNTGATGLSQFDAPNPKNSSAKRFSKKRTFEQLQFETFKNLCTFLIFFHTEVKKYTYYFRFFWFEQIPLSDSEDIFCQCCLDRALFCETNLLEFIPNFLRRPKFSTPPRGNELIIN